MSRLHKQPFCIFISSISEAIFDFVVVGAGSTGSTIAGRLSENPQWNVLLIEAGEEAQLLSEAPGLTVLQQFTRDNWNYTYEPQKEACLGMVEGRCCLPRGKSLGGTSNLNYAMYSRAHHLNFDYWAELGNEGWSYEDVLPYFVKSEHALAEDWTAQPDRGTEGPLYTNWTYREDFGEAFVQAGIQKGYKYCPDYNSPDGLGFAYMQGTILHGRRWSTYKAFVEPNLARPNLDVTTRSLATRILVDPVSNKAYGVLYLKDGTTRVAYATKEVIVSAGSINSPQLLMLSGIGPKEELEKFSIPLVKNLPVGKVLYEHLLLFNIIITTNVTLNMDFLQQMLDFIYDGKGVLSSIGGLSAVAFFNSNSALEGKVAPDLEILLSTQDASANAQSNVKSLLYRQEILDYFLPTQNITTFTMAPIILQPKSKGNLKLRSNNPEDPPLAYGNFFTDPQDIQDLLTITRITLGLLDTPAFQKFDAKLAPTPLPGCENYVFNSDEYWICFIKQSASTVYHPMSTCKMGPKDDEEAVVNNRLNVYGVEGLRVADASIFPYAISGHPNAVCVMIGEKLVDIIKEDWLTSRCH